MMALLFNDVKRRQTSRDFVDVLSIRLSVVMVAVLIVCRLSDSIDGLYVQAISESEYRISYQNQPCDNSRCPKWMYCGVSRTSCQPCARCNPVSDDEEGLAGVIDSCRYPAQCIQSARPRTAVFYTCQALSVVDGRQCQGLCQPHAVGGLTAGGSPLGTRCQLRCDDVVDSRSSQQVLSCGWNTGEAKAVWNDTLMDGFVLVNDTISTVSPSSPSVNNSDSNELLELTARPSSDSGVQRQQLIALVCVVIIVFITVVVILVITFTIVVIRRGRCKKLCDINNNTVEVIYSPYTVTSSAEETEDLNVTSEARENEDPMTTDSSLISSGRGTASSDNQSPCDSLGLVPCENDVDEEVEDTSGETRLKTTSMSACDHDDIPTFHDYAARSFLCRLLSIGGSPHEPV